MRIAERGVPSPGSPLRVLRVVTVASRSGRYGGPFDTAMRQTRALQRAGLTARVLAGAFQGDLPDADVLATGRYVTVRGMLALGGFSTAFSLRMALATLREVLRSDVVYVSFAREAVPVWAAIVVVFTGRALVIQPHGMLTSRSSRAHRAADRMLIRPLFQRARAVVALSEVEADELRAWCGPKSTPNTTVLGNPLPPSVPAVAEPRAAPGEEQVTIAFIARLHPRKRVEDFIEAARQAETRGLRWRWLIAGPDDGDGDRVRRAARQSTVIDYVGAVPAAEVVHLVNSSSVFVLPAEREPWGNVLATAIALGVPSIVTHSAALAARIQRYGAGAVVPDHDPLELLKAAEAMMRPARYRAASEGALRLRADLLDPDALQRNLAAVIFKAVGRTTSSSLH